MNNQIKLNYRILSKEFKEIIQSTKEKTLNIGVSEVDTKILVRGICLALSSKDFNNFTDNQFAIIKQYTQDSDLEYNNESDYDLSKFDNNLSEEYVSISDKIIEDLHDIASIKMTTPSVDSTLVTSGDYIAFLAGDIEEMLYSDVSIEDAVCDVGCDIDYENLKMRDRNLPHRSYLDDLCVKLSSLEVNSSDLMSSREREISEIEMILMRKTKSNPLLIGDPGVGKTYIINGLARNIASGNTSEYLKDKELYSISSGTLVSGTKYRGDLEKKVSGLISELKDNPNKILFIDEIHTIMKSDSEVADLIKPVLATGEVKIIGATTTEEYRKYFFKDKAMLRRFNVVRIDEPTEEDVMSMLIASKDLYEDHHKVTMDEDFLKSIVKHASYISGESRNPDKSFDLLDRSLALSSKMNIDVDESVIVQAASRYESYGRVESKSLESTKEQITSLILGQTNQINNIIDIIEINTSGMVRSNTAGNFLISGESGVGKTMFAKELAKSLNMNLIKMDMSNYSESHSVSKIVGSPPGYKGSDKGGILSEKIFANPRSLVLLDEIEKSSKDVVNLFLSILEDGVIEDSMGRRISVSKCIFIFTSNAGLGSNSNMGFNNETKNQKEKLKNFFTKEFLNRMDSIQSFEKISSDDYERIIENELTASIEWASKSNKLKINYDKKVVKYIKQQVNVEMGVRDIAPTVKKHILYEINNIFLRDKNKKQYKITVDDNKVKVE